MNGILFLADLHGGMTTHDGPDTDGSHSWRANELRQVVRAAVERANELRANLVLPGDVFHRRKIEPWAYLAIGEELSQADSEVYAIPGNHDPVSPAGIPSPMGVLAAYGVNVLTRPVSIEIGGLDVLLLPWPSRAWIESLDPRAPVAEQHRQMAVAIERLVGAFAADCDQGKGLARAVVTHATIAGASYNEAMQPQLGDSSEFIIPLPAIAHPSLTAVVSGHIHKAQDFVGGECPVHYVGSAVRHDFGEEGQPCRVLHLDPRGECYGFELPAREFVTYEVPSPVSMPDVRGKVVRLKGELPAGPETAANIAANHKMMEDAGALRIGKPAITYTRHDAPKRSSLTVEMTPTQALERYIEEVGGEYAARRNELMRMHEEVSS